jgi:hypothetical protein
MMPVLDCHTHIFPPEAIRRRERIAGDDKGFAAIYGDGRARMVDAEGLAEYMDREGVDLAAAGCFPFRDASLLRLANDYVLDAAKKDRRIMPFILVDRYDEAKALDEARRCFELGAAGVGEIAWYDAPFGASERKSLDALAAYMEQTGMALLMHLNEPVGHRYPGKTEADFREVATFVEAHPSLKIILAHLGGGLCFYELMPEIRKAFALVSYDLAASPFLYSDDLYRFAATFLPDKVLFGSDYPLLALSRYKPLLDGLEERVREKFLWGNGSRFFGDRSG